MGLPIIKHNPAFLSDQELKERFVVRFKELDMLLDCVRSNTGEVNQHVLAIAPRGMGKTMLMRRLALEVNTDPELSRRWLPVLLPEESYSVATEGEFWLRVLTYAAHLSGDSRWDPILGRLRTERDEFRLRTQSLGRLRELAEILDRRLLVVIENMNILLGEQARNKTGWDLRKTLLSEPFVMLVATATTHFEEIRNANQAMYELFREIKLQPISTEECRALWQAITGEALEGIRVRPLEILTGGNPRLVSILASFSVGTAFSRIMEDLIVLIDDHTTYFKSNVESLPPLERRVFATLAEIWAPAAAREVAELARLGVNEASALLKRLVLRGAVVVTERIGRKAFYQVAERLYNIYHIMRQSGSVAERARAAVDFMVRFYSPDHLAHCIAEEACRIAPDGAGAHIEAYRHIIDRFSDNQSELEKIVSLTPGAFYQIPGLPADIIERVDSVTYSSSRDEIETLFLQAGKTAETSAEEAIGMYDQIIEKYEDKKGSHVVTARALLNKGRALGALGRPEEEIAVYDLPLQHVEEVGGLAQVGPGRKRRRAAADPAPGGDDGGKPGDQADRHAHAGFPRRPADVRVVGRQHADRGLEHVHGQSVRGQAAQGVKDRVGNGPVGGDLLREGGKRPAVRELFEEQQVRDLLEGRALGQVLDQVAAVDQPARLAVHVADPGAGDGDPAQPGVDEGFAFFRHSKNLYGAFAVRCRSTCRLRCRSGCRWRFP